MSNSFVILAQAAQDGLKPGPKRFESNLEQLLRLRSRFCTESPNTAVVQSTFHLIIRSVFVRKGKLTENKAINRVWNEINQRITLHRMNEHEIKKI